MATRWGEVLTTHLRRFVPPLGERFRLSWDLYALSQTLINEQHDDSSEQFADGDDLIWGIGTRKPIPRKTLPKPSPFGCNRDHVGGASTRNGRR